MKTNWIIIISLVLVFLTVAFAVVSLTGLIKDVEGSLPTNNTGNAGNIGDAGNNNSGSTDGTGNTDNPGNTEGEGNTESPGNMGGELAAELFELVGTPKFYYLPAEYTSTGKESFGIQFGAKISDFLKASVHDRGVGQFKWFVAPYDNFEKVGVANETNIDWVKAFSDASVEYLIIDNLESVFSNQQADGNYIAYGGLCSIRFKNINRPMCGIMYIEYADGTRQYAAFPEGYSVYALSASLGYVAVEAFNDFHIRNVNGLSVDQDYPESKLQCLRECIRLSAGDMVNVENEADVPVDLTYQPMIETESGHTFAVKCSLTVGETVNFKVITGTTISGWDYGFRIVAWSSDPGVARIDGSIEAIILQNGAVTAVGKGTCIIYCYCGWRCCQINVTVT